MSLKKFNVAFEMPLAGYSEATPEWIAKALLHRFQKAMDEWCSQERMSRGDLTAKVSDADSDAYYKVTY